MNKKLTRTMTTALLLAGVIAFGLAAQPGNSHPQGEEGPPHLDLAAAAVTLNVTEEALIAALALPENGPQGEQPARPEREEHERPDLAAAAVTLGITEDDLETALGDPEQGRPDLAAAAAALGITEEALMDALGVPADRPEGGPGGDNPDQMGHEPPTIDFAAAAETLGVTEEALIEALGVSAEGLQSNGPPSHGQRRSARGGRR